MSLYLGRIHYWLHNKILWAENAEAAVIRWAKSQNLPAEQWICRNMELYGAPAGNLPLEQIIDTSNIHGWLQQRIESTELRQAALVTAILEHDARLLQDLVAIFREQGSTAAEECGSSPETPEGMFEALHDYILEGMPCDRVNEVISDNGSEIVWKTTQCLHAPYWGQVRGNVENFYDLIEGTILVGSEFFE